jgi:4-hydroxybenzoate polyprenyltransferase
MDQDLGMNLSAYYRLSRFHKPAGTLLLWAPTAWALWLANQGHPSIRLVLLFFLGTVVMRAAGCVMNDIADRHIDSHVERTKTRPLTSGEVSLVEALGLLILYLMIALIILLQLPDTCFYYAILALAVTVIYPFCKRFLEAPQLILGIAFSMGIPMAYAASEVTPDMTMMYLLLLNFFWILAYDTQYAMVDRVDDLLIGVKSTAVLFGKKDTLIIGLFHGVTQILWLVLATNYGLSGSFYLGWVIATMLLMYQQKLTYLREENRCWQAFISNGWYGLIMWGALLVSFH